MAKAVFIQNPTSIYRDEPGVRYHFPKMYLSTVQGCVGDWVVFYEGRRGVLGYTSVQRVLGVSPDPEQAGHFFADLDPGSLWQFERIVPRATPDGAPYETMLRRPDGRPIRGGANTLAVRRLPPADFAAIVAAGLNAPEGAAIASTVRNDPDETGHRRPELDDAPARFDHEMPLAGFRPEILSSRPARDASFARMVKAAYGNRCAISGLALRNGGPEVQAAHIRPVSRDGPDIVANGLALSGTLHWMFDHGLISVADDLSILVAHNKVDTDTVRRLIVPEMRLRLPENSRDHPHPAYLRFHREEIYGGLA